MPSEEEIKTIWVAEGRTGSFEKAMRRVDEALNRFATRLGLANAATGANAKVLDQQSRQIRQTSKDTRQAARNTHWFSMELLGVGFFGKMVSDVFLGMLRPATEALGLFQLFADTLTVLFLPIMIELFPYLLGFAEWLMNLPTWVQLGFGAFTLLIGGLGLLLSYLGFTLLGLQSFVKAFPLLVTAISGLFGWIGKLGKAILTLNGAISLSQGLMLIGWIGAIIAFIAVLVKLEQKFGSFGAAIKAWASGIVLAVALVVQGVVDMVFSLINKVIGAIQSLVNKAANVASSLGMEWAAGKLRGISTMLGNLGSGGIDIMGGVASLLNSAGFNPSPVASSMSGQDLSQFARVNAMQASGMSNADIVNASAGQKMGASPVYNTTYNIMVPSQEEIRREVERLQKEHEARMRLYGASYTG